MSKTTKQKWSCNTCKFKGNTSPQIIRKKDNTTQVKYHDINTISNENFKNLTASVNFMSDKFDNFGKQIQEVLSSMKEMREENRFLKE
jgi:hypothetical protein